jgi:hypothetical protein
MVGELFGVALGWVLTFGALTLLRGDMSRRRNINHLPLGLGPIVVVAIIHIISHGSWLFIVRTSGAVLLIWLVGIGQRVRTFGVLRLPRRDMNRRRNISHLALGFGPIVVVAIIHLIGHGCWLCIIGTSGTVLLSSATPGSWLVRLRELLALGSPSRFFFRHKGELTCFGDLGQSANVVGTTNVKNV